MNTKKSILANLTILLSLTTSVIQAEGLEEHLQETLRVACEAHEKLNKKYRRAFENGKAEIETYGERHMIDYYAGGGEPMTKIIREREEHLANLDELESSLTPEEAEILRAAIDGKAIAEVERLLKARKGTNDYLEYMGESLGIQYKGTTIKDGRLVAEFTYPLPIGQKKVEEIQAFLDLEKGKITSNTADPIKMTDPEACDPFGSFYMQAVAHPKSSIADQKTKSGYQLGSGPQHHDEAAKPAEVVSPGR